MLLCALRSLDEDSQFVGACPLFSHVYEYVVVYACARVCVLYEGSQAVRTRECGWVGLQESGWRSASVFGACTFVYFSLRVCVSVCLRVCVRERVRVPLLMLGALLASSMVKRTA